MRMSLRLVHQPLAAASASPYRLLDAQGREVVWANAFLDAQRVRQLSPRSLRAYAYDLLHFARWLKDVPLSGITESTLLDYVRHQLDQEPKPAPPTVNHRLGVVHCLYRFHCGREIPPGGSHFQRTYTRRSPLGYGRPRRALALGLRLRQPRRVVVPLAAEEVAAFWRSFRTFRDLPCSSFGCRRIDCLASRSRRGIATVESGPARLWSAVRCLLYLVLLARSPPSVLGPKP
jgi:hypothetical protein